MSRSSTSASATRSDRVKADFVTVASHQLRTPISVIRWSLDILESGRAGTLSEGQSQYLRQAYEQVNFMARIVNDLLRVSRIDEGKVAIRPESFDLVRLLDLIVHDTKQVAQAYNCRLVVISPPTLPPIFADLVKTREVFQTLIDNAIRYSRGRGRIRITVRRRPRGSYVVSVADSGIGIPRQAQRNLFHKFFRAGNAMRVQTAGMGLQLYIIKHYVEAMGGSIGFTSEHNRGTTFTVRIPARVRVLPAQQLRPPEVRLTDDELEYLYHHISDGLIIVGPDRKLLKINPVVARVFGLDEARIHGVDALNAIRHPQVRAVIRALPQQEQHQERNVVVKIAPGDTVTYRLVTFPIRNNGAIEGWILLLHDTSRPPESLGVERSIRKEHEFVSITVHELKSPLGMTKWSLEMLQSERLGKLTGEQRELIDQIYRDNERLLILVRDLLNLARLQEGRFAVVRRVISFSSVLRDAVDHYRHAAAERRLRLRVQPPAAALPKVRADRARILQVLSNLLSNAVKYSRAGGTITVGCKHVSGRQLRSLIAHFPRVRLEYLDQSADFLLVWIRDTGIGIARNQQTQLFTKFYRGSGVLKANTEGTGLGLYISKSIISLHNGDIWFTSALGKGSTFYFTLPLA